MWLNKFKIALAQKDTDSLEKLLDEIPEFSDINDMKQSLYLFREATELLFSLKDETSASMRQIKKNIDFIRSTHNESSNKLDVKL